MEMGAVGGGGERKGREEEESGGERGGGRGVGEEGVCVCGGGGFVCVNVCVLFLITDDQSISQYHSLQYCNFNQTHTPIFSATP